MIDFNSKWRLDLETKRQIITEAHFNLTEKDMIKALSSNTVHISGVYYHTPKRQLIHYLFYKQFGQVKLRLLTNDQENDTTL
jgi:hypothetical protein